MNHAESRLEDALLADARTDVSAHDEKVSIDALTLGRDPTAPTGHWQQWSLAIVTVLSCIAALAMIGAHDHREPGTLGSLPISLDILVLGDASAGSEGCARCFTYVDQLASAESEQGIRIHIHDKIMSARTEPPSIAALVDDLRSTPELRAAVTKADLILLALGSGDVTHPAADCPASQRTRCSTRPIPQFRQSLADWISETEAIRHHRSVKLRVITTPPTSGSPRQNDVARTACEIAAARDAQCVNVFDLARTDEHVVSARADPSHPRLTQHGHDLVAAQLIASGIT